MRRSRQTLILLVVLAGAILTTPLTASATSIAHLTLKSEAGDFIGQGGSFDISYTPFDSMAFFVNVIPVAPTPSFVRFVLGTVTSGSDNTFAILDFSTTQLGIVIQPGLYLNAERASFADPGHPGLDVSFQNRGCNTLTGNFSVDEAAFSPDGLTIETFGTTFEQHCEGLGPALFGSFQFDASGTLVPEPSPLVLIGFGLGSSVFRRRRPSSASCSS
jgi:hypothetical protein